MGRRTMRVRAWNIGHSKHTFVAFAPLVASVSRANERRTPVVRAHGASRATIIHYVDRSIDRAIDRAIGRRSSSLVARRHGDIDDDDDE